MDDRLPATAAQSDVEDGALSRVRLRDALAALYDDEASARRVAIDAGLDGRRIAFGTQALNTWHAILAEAEKSNRVEALLAIVLAEYKENTTLSATIATFRQTVLEIMAARSNVASATTATDDARSSRPEQPTPAQTRKRQPIANIAPSDAQPGIHAVHVTLLQLYLFPEPIFAPEKLATVGLWERLPRRKDEEVERPGAIFQRRVALRHWIRRGRPIVVPNLGIMKPLRRPHLPTDRFYQPFFAENEVLDAKLLKQDGPLPFYPIQLLPRERNCQIRLDPQQTNALATLLGQPLQTSSAVPMLLIYPTGCFSVQLRLYLETVEPLQATNLNQLLKTWGALPWSIRNKTEGAGMYRTGVPQLLDELAQRFRREIIADTATITAAKATARADSFVLVNVQGSLHDSTTGKRHKQAQLWLSQLAGVEYGDAEKATIFGQRYQEDEPWLILGKQRAALAVDNAVYHHSSKRGESCILEARRALRNRTLSTIEFALATRLLCSHYGEQLQAEQRKAELDALQRFQQRVVNWWRDPKLDARIYGSLLFEIAPIRDNLTKADPRNAAMWIALFDAILGKDDRGNIVATELSQRVQQAAQALREEIRHRRSARFEQVTTLIDLLMQFKTLLPTESAA